MQDFLYLFKNNRIYAILGDVANGQLIDVDKTIGTEYKNMIVQWNNKVYFMNRDGIYMINGRQVIDIERFRLDDLFSINLKATIDFDAILENGFVFMDTKKQDIVWHVPLANIDASEIVTSYNVAAVVYNIPTNTFRTYAYGDTIFTHTRIKDLNNTDRILMGTYDGRIKEMSLDNSDDGTNIFWILRTKAFNAATSFIRKAYNLIKVSGEQVKGVRVQAEIDGRLVTGGSTYRQRASGMGEIIFNMPNRGGGDEIEIIVEGSDIDSAPTLIREIILGYSRLRGTR